MNTHTPTTTEVKRVTIVFSGDSGDGMQLTGTQFTTASAVHGNDVNTQPDYPSEIRAPVGSIAGVSAFQLSFAAEKIHTAGDRPDVLVAMNPAALKVYLPTLRPGGELVVNQDAFTANDLKKAGYDENPLDDPELASRFKLHSVPITSLTLAALEEVDLDRKGKRRCKNFFALGLLYWLYDRPVEPSRKWIGKKFARYPAVVEANRRALEAGYKHGAADGTFSERFAVPRRRKSRATTGSSTATRHSRSAASPPHVWPGSPSSTAAIRSHRRPKCCTRSRGSSTWMCARSRPRMKSPPWARPSGLHSAVCFRSPERADPASA